MVAGQSVFRGSCSGRGEGAWPPAAASGALTACRLRRQAITCAADDEDVQAHNADRLYLRKHLAGALYERVKSGPSDPIVIALSVLNHEWWPDVDLKQDKL